jgi:hypothetical protein
MKINFISFLIVILFTLSVHSQLQSPSKFLGYDLGNRFTRHHQVIDYFKHVAANSTNVKLEQYGDTYENRPLFTAVITSAYNFKKLDKIRKNHLKASGIGGSEYVDDGIAIVWLSYGVHGNESVSSEVSMKVLYDLVNPDHKTSKKWLENTVVIIDPSVNPDGRDRYVNWYYQKGNFPYNTNPDVIEHHEPWPGGRANHYLFDLNRDWAWATQIETQKRLVVYNNWLPHIHVDFHEQGVDAPYYFAPAAEPFHDVITDFQREFQITIGKNNAKYFDKNGWLYFTKERFDLLYPSYGDTYPTYSGAIGMTYEQGGSGRAGLGIINKEGDELSLKDRFAHHYATSMSTIEVSSMHAKELTKEFVAYFRKSINNPQGKYKTYVIKNENADQINSLTDLLDQHKIKYGSVTSNKSFNGFSYLHNTSEKFKINANDLIISAYQPKSNLIKALFEPQTKLSDSLTYDITAWALPYARGLNAYASMVKLNVNPYQKITNKISTKNLVKPYAYISRWKSLNDVSFLSELLKKKVKVRFSKKDFTIDGQTFKAGSLVITRTGNQKNKEFDEIVRAAAKKMERNVVEVSTGLVDSGKDFGSGSVRYLKAPKVAVLSGKGISSLGFGAIWHFFEQQIKYPIHVIGTDYFSSVDLHDYNVLILPSGYYSKVLNKSNLEKVTNWVRNGGKLIVISTAVSVFANSENYDISNYEDDKTKSAVKKSKDSLKKAVRLKPHDEQERSYISNLITGSVFMATLDNTYPLAFGYGKYYYTLKQGNNRFSYLKNGNNVSVIKDVSKLISGFAGKNALKSIKESLVYGVENKGKGTVVYLVDDPLFRSFWENGKLLFSNAVFLVGQ